MKVSSKRFNTDEEWFGHGKSDAWLGKAKQAPEEDPCAASQYDLGYSEGSTRHPPIVPTSG
ncbi:MAG: hypothetical protein WCD18_07895 [Thermosynechococcaceae cyanobacterium]